MKIAPRFEIECTKCRGSVIETKEDTADDPLLEMGDLADDARFLSGRKRHDLFHEPPVFVAERQAVQQIFDGDEARAFEVGRLARTDALQELKRSRERIRQALVDYCTTTACPCPTSICLICAGSRNGSFRRTPSGFFEVLE